MWRQYCWLHVIRMRKYEDWILIGSGTFSEVYRVKEKKTGKLFACKIVSDTTLEKMVHKEVAFLRQANHPLFPIFKEYIAGEAQHYIFMEHISGSNLRELVRRRKKLSGKQAIRIVWALTEGLCYLHELSEPIIFRDVKPENVIIQQDGRVRLVDMGCACYLEAKDGAIAGSRGYGAPELFEKGGIPGRESDVYALGKLLDFMLGGEENMSTELRRMVEEATEIQQRNRIPDMHVFKSKLEECNVKFPKRKKRHKDGFYYEINVKKGIC